MRKRKGESDVAAQLARLAVGGSGGSSAAAPPASSRPAPSPLVLPGELLLKIMQTLAESHDRTTLLRLMRASDLCYELGLPLIHRRVDMGEDDQKGLNVQTWLDYLQGGSKRCHGVVRELSITVPSLGWPEAHAGEALQAWKRVVALALEKLVGLERAQLNLEQGLLAPWQYQAGERHDRRTVFGAARVATTLRSLDIVAGKGHPAGCYGILRALEPHAMGTVFESLTFSSESGLPELSRFPASARKLRVLHTSALDFDEAQRFAINLEDAVGTSALEEVHVTVVAGLDVEPLLPFLEDRCPRLRHLSFTSLRGMPDLGPFPLAASRLRSLDLESAEDWAAALRTPGVRPAEIAVPAFTFFDFLQDRIAGADWVRDLEVVFSARHTFLPGAALAVVTANLPPRLQSLAIHVNTIDDPSDPRRFVDGLAAVMQGGPLRFALKIAQTKLRPRAGTFFGGVVHVDAEEWIWRWRDVEGSWMFVHES
ncbi:hypothetical protein DFJ74DRAFT_693611 [Hyaloraphidium curvatum]|nr:hypothetical protein DFJ74DRAFT_693611 [Hyaloraphidium curvatum]